jgi:hypothetical protein
LIFSSFFSFLLFNLSQAAFQINIRACLRGALILYFHKIFSLVGVCTGGDTDGQTHGEQGMRKVVFPGTLISFSEGLDCVT